MFNSICQTFYPVLYTVRKVIFL